MAESEYPIRPQAWHFDNYGSTPSTGKVVISEHETCPQDSVTVFVADKIEMTISALRDQWGTWITFEIGECGFTIAQEDQTRSFMDSFIAALEQLRPLCNILTEPPTKEPSDGT